MKRSVLLLCFLVTLVRTATRCPRLPSGEVLTCAFDCCESFEGKDQGYHCCGGTDDQKIVSNDGTRLRSERFVAYSNGFQIDYSLLILGIVISIILSILLSLLCCLLCNGCWLHRRRNSPDYGHVTEQDSGFYPICCGFGIPTGTLVFSTHPPQFRNEDVYGSNTSRNVRFNDSGVPRSVLKNSSNYSS